MSSDKENKNDNGNNGECVCKCSSSRGAKRIKIVLCSLAAFVLLVVIGILFLGLMIKTGIQTVGSTVTKCDVSVDSVSVSLLRGRLEMKNLVMSNPEGYKTDSAFRLGRIFVSMHPMSIFSGDKITIDEIIIEGPEITYEMNLLAFTSNIGAIQKNVQSFVPESGEDDAKKDKEDKEEKSKTVQISRILVSDGKINLSATVAGGLAVPVPLPTIELKDIGKDEDITPPEATATVLNEVCGSVSSTAKEASKSLYDAAKTSGKVSGEAVDSIKDAGKSLLNVLKNKK